jgi:hypothetical protein
VVRTPYKERYIAGSSTCSTKELSIHLTKILFAVKEGQQKYCETVYSRSGINHMWILKNSKDLTLLRMCRLFRQCSKCSESVHSFQTMFRMFRGFRQCSECSDSVQTFQNVRNLFILFKQCSECSEYVQTLSVSLDSSFLIGTLVFASVYMYKTNDQI